MSIARFGVRKPVPVNLLMIAVLLAGAVSGLSLRREFFPEIAPDQALIELRYPGATPREVEESLAIKVEDAVAELDEVKELRTTLSENGGGITVEFHEGVDVDEALDEVERAVDALTDLPQEAEKIRVRLFEPRIPVIRVTVFGELEEKVLKQTIRDVRDDLRSLPGMGQVLVSGVRDFEIRVDVERGAMLRHGISLPEVADTIRAWMTETPGGTVRSPQGNVKIRTMGVQERARAIDRIALRADPEGRATLVGDIATVRESFVDEQVINRYNGQAAASLTVFKTGDQDIVHMAEMVRAYVDGRNDQSPGNGGLKSRLKVGFGLGLWGDAKRREAWDLGRTSPRRLAAGARLAFNSDYARFVEGRLDLLLRNALYGGILVFLTLLLFLNWRVALWVGAGLLTALMGTLVLMHAAGITLNLLTMFGLIVVLGLLVDDAIVVAENIQSRHDRGQRALEAAIEGTEQVLWPVVATVLTTIVAFLPLTFIRGQIGDLLGALPMVVACALTMSLLESLLILPSHMGHSLAKRDRSTPGRMVTRIREMEQWRDHLVLERLVPLHGRVLAWLLRFRYATVAAAVAMLLISLGLVRSGHVAYEFLPASDAETIIVDLRMPIGSAIEQTDGAVARVEEAARQEPETRSVSTVVGQRNNIDTGAAEAFTPHVAQVFIELDAVEERQRDSQTIIASIRQRLRGRLDEVDRISYEEVSGGPAGPAISVRMHSLDSARTDAVVRQLKEILGGFQGVYDISDDQDLGQSEVQIELKPGAAALGFSVADIAHQVRGFLHGLDAHVFAAEQEDIDVRVRLDEQTRRSLPAIETSWVIGPSGGLVPLSEIADLRQTTGFATIKRVNRQRAVTVTADTAPGHSPEAIVAELPLDELRAAHPGVRIEFTGRQQQQKDAFDTLPLGFLAALVMIYVILAFLFSSYVQPIVVMLIIPFAMIGAVWGHLVLGFDITFLSLIGFVALSGIVVNDALILVEFYNAQRQRGDSVFDALVSAGKARLRAILLTTATTVLGLTPLILERSFQARFLIPMAISIAVGLLAATVLVLIVLPCFILILDDASRAGHFLWHGRARPAVPPPQIA